jgi:hypothetical protein
MAKSAAQDAELGGVAVEALWEKIAEGLYGGSEVAARADRGRLWVGHPDCNCYLPGLVLVERGREPRFEALRQAGDPIDERIVDGFLDRFGGVTFRLDGPVERAARWASLALRPPGIVLGGALRGAVHWLRRFDPQHPFRLLCRLAAGGACIRSLVIVTHHFMSRADAEWPRGKERRDLCVFHVPVGDALLPMCQVNALGVREEYYARLVEHHPLHTSA